LAARVPLGSAGGTYHVPQPFLLGGSLLFLPIIIPDFITRFRLSGLTTDCRIAFYPYMPMGKVWIYCLLFACVFVCRPVCVCVCLFVCTITDFSAEDKASNVKFFTAVHRRPRQGISHFEERRTVYPRGPRAD